MAQMLAAVDRHMVVSEPEIVNDILLLADELLAREQRLNLLKLVIGGLGTLPNGADRSRFFIKFSSWNVLALSAIRALFPAVPWVFVYRDPIEVMVSALGSSTGWLRTKHDRGRLLRFMGFSAEDAARLDDTEYSARVLGRFFESALEAPASERALLPYARMPEGVLEVIEGHFRIDLSNAERAAIMAVSAYDSKSGAGQRFRPDAESKRAQADARVHAASARWVDESYAALQARGT